MCIYTIIAVSLNFELKGGGDVRAKDGIMFTVGKESNVLFILLSLLSYCVPSHSLELKGLLLVEQNRKIDIHIQTYAEGGGI